MKISWSQLTAKLKSLVGYGCGIGKTALFIPQFIFETSCVQHDFYYRRGGGLFDKLEADAFFLAYMLRDISNCNKNIIAKLFFTLMAFIYYLLVSVFGLVAFHWGKYKTLEEIIKD